MNELRKFREKLGKTQEEMAKDFEISKSFYEKLEYGSKKPGRELIEKIKKKYPFIDVNIFLKQNNT